MSWLSLFEWCCVLCGVLCIACIVAGYPAIGGFGLVTFGLFGWADHRGRRPPDSGGDGPTGDRVPISPAPPTRPASQAMRPPDTNT